MQTITTVGLDIAKSVFQVHCVDAAEQVVLRRQLKRRYVLACPSSNVSGQSRRCWNEGSGSFGLEFKRLSTDVAIVAV